MNARSEQLKTMVGDLTALAGHAAEGKGSHRIAQERERHINKEPVQVQSRHALAAPARKHAKRQSKAEQTKEIKPEQVVALDEEDFTDFLIVDGKKTGIKKGLYQPLFYACCGGVGG
jgi:hypothetical protein